MSSFMTVKTFAVFPGPRHFSRVGLLHSANPWLLTASKRGFMSEHKLISKKQQMREKSLSVHLNIAQYAQENIS